MNEIWPISSIAVFDEEPQVLEEACAALKGYEVCPFDDPADAILQAEITV